MNQPRGGLSERCRMGECDACLGCADECHPSEASLSVQLAIAVFLIALLAGAILMVRR